MRPRSIKTELFVCPNCSHRQRLATAARHWCPECQPGPSFEMEPARRGAALKAAGGLTAQLENQRGA